MKYGKVRIDLNVPEELKMYYNTPSAPVFKSGRGELFAGQADGGDYGGAEKQGCMFISNDDGITWTYDGDVIKSN